MTSRGTILIVIIIIIIIVVVLIVIVIVVRIGHHDLIAFQEVCDVEGLVKFGVAQRQQAKQEDDLHVLFFSVLSTGMAVLGSCGETQTVR